MNKQYNSDPYQVKAAIKKLEKWRTSALAELARRSATARTIVDECTLALAKELNELEEEIQDHGEAAIAGFEGAGASIVAQLGIDGQLHHIGFVAATDKQGRKMTEFLNELVAQFEFWIKEKIRPVGHIVLLD